MALLRKLQVLVMILAFSGLSTGCATLFGTDDKMVQVASNPTGAQVFVNGQPYGRTPTSVQIADLLDDNYITFKLKGYDDVTRPIMTSIQPVAFLNLLNIICWGIDVVSGKVMKLDTKFITVDLTPKSAGLNHDVSSEAMRVTSEMVKPDVCRI